MIWWGIGVAVAYWIAARGVGVLTEIADHATGNEPHRWPARVWPLTLLALGIMTFTRDPEDDVL